MDRFTVSTPEAALSALDTRRPLLYSELYRVVYSLWEAGLREGKKQAASPGGHSEYQDPTTAIRRRLEEQQRASREQ